MMHVLIGVGTLGGGGQREAGSAPVRWKIVLRLCILIVGAVAVVAIVVAAVIFCFVTGQVGSPF